VNRNYFGDSYDMVKRFWADLLWEKARLYADPLFFEDEKLRLEFRNLTRIAMMTDEKPSDTYSILLDPDTGISPRGKAPQYVKIGYIARQVEKPGVRYVVTYDQSFPHCGEPVRREKMQQKMLTLGYPSLYYVSHAPFLFTAVSREALQELKTIITKAGVPKKLIEELGTVR